MSDFSPLYRFLSRLALMIALAAAGCAQKPPGLAPLNLPPAKPQRVEFQDLTARTSAVDAGSSLGADELLARVTAIEQGENVSARVHRLVERFPDAALEALRDTSAAQAAQPDRVAVAIAYDRSFVAAGSFGWTRAFADAAVHASDFQSLHEARALALQFIEMGRPERVLSQVRVPAASSLDFEQAELLRVRGIASLLCDRPGDALRDWQTAEQLARADRSVRCELCLLEAQALRRLGSSPRAEARWAAAAVLASAIHDPNLWQRLLDARNASQPWPSQVAAAFDTIGGAPTTAPSDAEATSPSRTEACVWRQIGQWRFARGEAPAALLAFKQAESAFAAPRDRAEARIAQARVLLTINQVGAAVSILTALSTDADPLVSHHALAVLGNARVAVDDLPGALTLLQAAVANDESFPLAMRAPARADLGLVYLMSSHEKEGLAWLHRAQADFQEDGDDADLVQSLDNEAAYFDQAGRKDPAHAIRARASRISAKY